MTPRSALFVYIVTASLTLIAWVGGLKYLQDNAPDWVDEHRGGLVTYVLPIPLIIVPLLVTYIFIHKAAKKLRLSAAAKNTPGV